MGSHTSKDTSGERRHQPDPKPSHYRVEVYGMSGWLLSVDADPSWTVFDLTSRLMQLQDIDDQRSSIKLVKRNSREVLDQRKMLRSYIQEAAGALQVCQICTESECAKQEAACAAGYDCPFYDACKHVPLTLPICSGIADDYRARSDFDAKAELAAVFLLARVGTICETCGRKVGSCSDVAKLARRRRERECMLVATLSLHHAANDPGRRYSDIASLLLYSRNCQIGWVRSCYLHALHREGSKMPCRQGVPREAFYTFDELDHWCGTPTNHPVVVSHPWWSQEHPDPEGRSLEKVCRFLERMFNGTHDAVPVFVDFMSLFQGERTPTQDRLFSDALQGINILYRHDRTLVLRLSEDPGPTAPNPRPYHQRGWCVFEHRASELKSCADLTVSFTGFMQRGLPEAPLSVMSQEDFAREMARLQFTAGPVDRALVAKKYAELLAPSTHPEFQALEDHVSLDWLFERWKEAPFCEGVESNRLYCQYCGAAICFASAGAVQMVGGRSARVDSVSKGDHVLTPEGPAEVVCVVRSTVASSSCWLTRLEGGLQLTPGHPVRISGRWFPARDCGSTERVPCSHLYNFVLSSGHIVYVNGIECVTLGHGFQDQGVAHKYFGSQRVIDSLRSKPGWADGLVEQEAGKDQCTCGEKNRSLGQERQIGFLGGLVTELPVRSAPFVGPELLLSIHRAAMEVTDIQTEFRQQPVMIRGKQHVPPEPGAVGRHVQRYCVETAQMIEEGEGAFTVGAFCLWWVTSVHPFEDGNGRAARGLALVLIAALLRRAAIDSAEGGRAGQPSLPHFHQVLEVLRERRRHGQLSSCLMRLDAEGGFCSCCAVPSRRKMDAALLQPLADLLSYSYSEAATAVAS